MNTNTGIIGTMGTGKTQFTKSLVTQLMRNQSCNVDGKPIGLLIFDYKSDYVDEAFLDATGAKSTSYLSCLTTLISIWRYANATNPYRWWTIGNDGESLWVGP